VVTEGVPREVMTEEEKMKDRLRILLLGPPAAGKSTLYRQCMMRRDEEG
jgi:GTPase SAR1 family protein